MPDATKPKLRKGFAAMSPERQREIASLGGRSVRAENRSFAKDPALASSAGKLGGTNVPPEKRSFSTDPELARTSGAKGGQNSHGGRKEEVP